MILIYDLILIQKYTDYPSKVIQTLHRLSNTLNTIMSHSALKDTSFLVVIHRDGGISFNLVNDQNADTMSDERKTEEKQRKIPSWYNQAIPWRPKENAQQKAVGAKSKRFLESEENPCGPMKLLRTLLEENGQLKAENDRLKKGSEMEGAFQRLNAEWNRLDVFRENVERQQRTAQEMSDRLKEWMTSLEAKQENLENKRLDFELQKEKMMSLLMRHSDESKGLSMEYTDAVSLPTPTQSMTIEESKSESKSDSQGQLRKKVDEHFTKTRRESTKDATSTAEMLRTLVRRQSVSKRQKEVEIQREYLRAERERMTQDAQRWSTMQMDWKEHKSKLQKPVKLQKSKTMGAQAEAEVDVKYLKSEYARLRRESAQLAKDREDLEQTRMSVAKRMSAAISQVPNPQRAIKRNRYTIGNIQNADYEKVEADFIRQIQQHHQMNGDLNAAPRERAFLEERRQRKKTRIDAEELKQQKFAAYTEALQQRKLEKLRGFIPRPTEMLRAPKIPNTRRSL